MCLPTNNLKSCPKVITPPSINTFNNIVQNLSLFRYVIRGSKKYSNNCVLAIHGVQNYFYGFYSSMLSGSSIRPLKAPRNFAPAAPSTTR